MKEIVLSAKGLARFKKLDRDYYDRDFDNIPRSITPGEMVYIHDFKGNMKAVAIANLFVLAGPTVRIVSFTETKLKDMNIWSEVVEANINVAIERRNVFKGYEKGCRLIYGDNDDLPGLIVDMYKNYIFIQINTAGLDKFRTNIKEFFTKQYESKNVVFLDNQDYRKNEVLPEYATDEIIEDVIVEENEFTYRIPKRVMQKIGYYYDHRENRKKLENKLNELNVDLTNGLDLFSYVGSWGLHLLRAGVSNVTFVDQGDMEEVTNANIKLNDFEGKSDFVRSDVFKFLDTAKNNTLKYNVIVSDPPAFTKSEKNKRNAIQGYEKLHTKIMPLLDKKSVFVAASCTQYVDIKELDTTVKLAALKFGRKLQLLDMGLQGHDHKVEHLDNKSNYIKYLIYLVK